MKALQQQPYIPPSVEYTLKITEGPEAGATYSLVAEVCKIGRAPTNDIPLLRDLRCSREQALIHISSERIYIKNLQPQNPIRVNDLRGEEFDLKNGSRIQLGSSTLEFGIKMHVAPPHAPSTKGRHLSVAPNMPTAASPLSATPGMASMTSSGIPTMSGHLGFKSTAQAPSKTFSPSASLPKLNSMDPKKVRFYGLIGVVLLLAAFLMTGESNKKKARKLSTEDEINHRIETTEEMAKAEQKELVDNKLKNENYFKAQAEYVNGFRDFRKGQYERAISTFGACLAWDPQHALCARYKKLAEKKFHELIQYHMLLGREYLEQGQYDACKSSFKNAMIMLRNPENVVYKEAKSNYIICNSRLQGRY